MGITAYKNLLVGGSSILSIELWISNLYKIYLVKTVLIKCRLITLYLAFPSFNG